MRPLALASLLSCSQAIGRRRAGGFRLRPEIAWLRGYGDDGSDRQFGVIGNYRQFGLALEFHAEDSGGEEDEDDSIFSPK